jgi:hypothetical protein
MLERRFLSDVLHKRNNALPSLGRAIASQALARATTMSQYFCKYSSHAPHFNLMHYDGAINYG